jgi:hypothetical protein
MRAIEFVIENKKGQLNPEQESTMSNLSTFPGQNMYHGSGFLHNRFIKALAGAGAGNTPDADMGEQPWDGGDPIYSPFHPVEEEMLDRAAKHVGDNSRRNWGDKRSLEPDTVHKISPHRDPGAIKLNKK